MENKELTPSESLALITSVIMDAKSRFKDNGFSFIFLGLCAAVASFGQFVLLRAGAYHISYYPYFIMPVAGIITYFYYKRKREAVRSKNMIGTVLSVLGAILGLNLMVAGFFFWKQFGIALIPFMLVLFSVWPLLTGVLIRNKVFIISGLLINITAFATFFISREYHPLVLSLVSLLGLVVPGLVVKFSAR
jgi:hypothetical protein